MKICSIEFKNHPILKNLKLDFIDKKTKKPYDTIVVGGENGCGKTALLKEISTLLTASIHYYPNNDNNNNNNYNIQFKISANDNEKKIASIIHNDFFQEINNLTIIKKINGQAKNVEFKTLPPDTTESQYLTSLNVLVSQNNTRLFQSIFIDAIIYDNSTPIRSTTATTLDSENMNSILHYDNSETQRIKQLLVDIDVEDALDIKSIFNNNEYNNKTIKEIKDNNFTSKRIERFAKAFNYMFEETGLRFDEIKHENNKISILFNKKGISIDIDDLSSGEKQIIYKGALLLKNKLILNGRIILIDEPENSMHPNWQKRILNYYKMICSDDNEKQFCQIFIATHSPFIILNEDSNNKVIVLKNDNGQILESRKEEYENKYLIDIVEDFDINKINSILKKTEYTVLLEGESDEIYFNKVKELFNIDKRYNFQWIGRLTEDGKAENTGVDALDKARNFLVANPNFIKDKIILLYDCDTKKKEEVIISHKLYSKCIEEKEKNNSKYTKGIENLLKLPKKFKYNKFTEKNKTKDGYGNINTITRLNKIKLATHICNEIEDNKCKNILNDFVEIIEQITQLVTNK